jgi:predicted metalloprotease
MPRAAPSRSRIRLRVLALVAAALSLMAILAFWAWGRTAPLVPARLSGDRAETIVRNTEVAFADAQRVWGRALKSAGARYRPATVAFFTNTGSPCGAAAGPSYCPETGTAAFDLGFLGALGPRLDRAEELALALVAARLAAEHVQRELGVLDAAALRLLSRRDERATIATALALQADCLTGVWAAMAAPRIGALPPDLYGRLVWSARNVGEERGALGSFALGARPDRERAFARGYAAGALSACPPPAEAAAG